MCVCPFSITGKRADDSLRGDQIVTSGQNIVLMKMNLPDLPGRSLAVVVDGMM
jgi:hypothetical protein